jgi:hypothetical protein
LAAAAQTRQPSQGNFIGTNANGTLPIGNGTGVEMSASNSTIGGTIGITPGGRCTGACNVFSGDSGAGVRLVEAHANRIEGNFIGLTADGTAALGNDTGVEITSMFPIVSPGNRIGGTAPAARNVISGNRQAGVEMSGSGASENQVQGNFIGTDTTGNLALPNNEGVQIKAGRNTIGGTTGTTPRGPATKRARMGPPCRCRRPGGGQAREGRPITARADLGALPLAAEATSRPRRS